MFEERPPGCVFFEADYLYRRLVGVDALMGFLARHEGAALSDQELAQLYGLADAPLVPASHTLPRLHR